MSRFVCLMYHDVSPDSQATDPRRRKLSPSILSYAVTTGQFAEHIAAIGGDRWMDPEDLRRPTAPAADGSPPRVLITFDDGWAGSVAEAGPLLEQAGARAILFVTTGLIGHPLFVSQGMLRDLPTKTFEVGAHTTTHPFLAECPTDVIRRELRDSRQTLEDILGRRVDTISIPNGSCNRRVLEIAEECEYAFVFTSEAHINLAAPGLKTIGRVAVRSETRTETLLRWTSGDIAGAGWRRRALEIPRAMLGPQRYRRLRSWALGEAQGQSDMAQLVREHQVNGAPLALAAGMN